jgi:hypothetical protein
MVAVARRLVCRRLVSLWGRLPHAARARIAVEAMMRAALV